MSYEAIYVQVKAFLKSLKMKKPSLLFLFVKRLHSSLNIMSLVAVKKRKSGKNRKDKNKVDRKERKESFPTCIFSSWGSRSIRLQ